MKVAIVGCGFQGRLHAESYLKVAGVKVVAACDTNPDRLEEMRALGVTASYTDYRSMLAAETDLDAVSICTMPVHHRWMTLEAFTRGLNVLCEKPIALNAAEAHEMCEAADGAGKVLAIGFNMRFMESPKLVRRLVDEGRLGDPVYTRVWGRSSHIPWWGEHYRKEISGGGALAATAVHLLDLGLWIAGFPRPVAASGSMATLFPQKRRGTAPSPEQASLYNTEDLLSAHVRFDNGFWMTVDGSWVDNRPSTAAEPSWDYSIDAIGTKGQAQVDPVAFLEEDGAGTLRNVLEDHTGSMDFATSVAELVSDFVGAVLQGVAPAVTGRQALVTQQIVDAIYVSAVQGHEVPVLGPGA